MSAILLDLLLIDIGKYPLQNHLLVVGLGLLISQRGRLNYERKARVGEELEVAVTVTEAAVVVVLLH
jgi:hypothetical protein